ncbi:MAG: cytochrome-c peroxidase, partial [Fluviicola sp.]
YNSKYDQYRKGETSLSTNEMQGMQLFQQKCASCHTEPLFTNYSYQNNGLDSIFSDLGRALITQNTSDEGKFKVPTLRNIELTYPYMHDGRFWTLQQVLNHYSSGVKGSSTLASGLSGGIPLTSQEKALIIDFLETLTDYDLLGNQLYYE